jgi:hypothetical protein
MTPKSARALAWLTFAVGIVVSVLGNIGHAASDGMQPGEWAGAAFWPISLLLSVEILVRIRWQPEKRWTVARFTGLIVVSIVAAILSYLHLRSLLIVWQYGAFQATIGPLAVDGLMLIAASALLSISKEHPQAVEKSAREIAVDRFAENLGIPPEIRDAVKSQPKPSWQTTPDTPEPSRLHIVDKVSTDDAEEAARQAWLESGRTLSSQQVANIAGMSKSTAHRRITREWANG